MAHNIDVTMLGCPDYGDGIDGEIDKGNSCVGLIKPMSKTAMAVWREVEAALAMELEERSEPKAAIADYDLAGLGWNDISQS